MNSFIEGLKQLLRVVVLAVIPVAITMLLDSKAAGHFVIDWFEISVVALLALFMGVDKWLHKEDTGVAGNGLTGF